MESYEGGTCTPFIVHWPGGLKKQENTINRGEGHVIDILPTCLELAGAKYPSEINGQKTASVDGKNLLPMLLGKTKAIHDTLFWEHEGGKAVRVGDWKIAARKNSEWELFDLSKDRSEAVNLSTKYPEKVQQMSLAWKKWAIKMGVK
jgi:arylsulfatase